MLVDAAIIMESFAVALLIRFNGEVVPLFWRTFWPLAIFAAVAFVLLLYVLLLRVARATAIVTWSSSLRASTWAPRGSDSWPSTWCRSR